MRAGIYTIHNMVEDFYSPLDIASSDVIAKRRFALSLNEGVKNNKNPIVKSDYELLCIGHIETDTHSILDTEKSVLGNYETIINDECVTPLFDNKAN